MEAAIKGKIEVCIVLLQNGADVNIKNADGKTAMDLADPVAKSVLTGEYHKDELLETARSGNEEKMMSLLTPMNVNINANDGRRSTVNTITSETFIRYSFSFYFQPLHLASGYNRVGIVQLLLQHG